MHGPLGSSLASCGGLLDFVEQRQDVAHITRIALGRQVRKDKTRGGFRDDPRLAATWRRTIALAFEHRGNRGVVGIDHFAMTQGLALGELCGLLANLLVMTHRGGEVLPESCTLRVTHCRRVLQVRVGVLTSGRNVFPERKECLCGLAHQLDEDLPVATTATTKAAHDFGEILSQRFNAVLHPCAAGMALRSDAGDAF